MSSAKSVARELVRLATSGPVSPPLTPSRLQGLVYYAQAWSLVLRGSELFPDEIHAVAEGPVVPGIFDPRDDQKTGQAINPASFDQEPNLDDEDEALFLRYLWAAYGPLSCAELLASIQAEAPFLEAKKEREMGGEGRIGMNELDEFFRRRSALPAPLGEYRRLHEEREKMAEQAILGGPPLDAEAIWKECRSCTPSASRQ